jgi:hypothetical protein
MKKLMRWALSGLYGLVMIEVIIMISPFAFYWYSLYAPHVTKLAPVAGDSLDGSFLSAALGDHDKCFFGVHAVEVRSLLL